MGLLGMFVVALLAFLVIDAIMLKFVIMPLFQQHVQDLLRTDMRLGVALGFYVFYVMGVIYFAVQPALAAGSVGPALLNGAILGFLAYGTYEATNMATLRGWSWTMVLTDVTWGTVLTATVAAIGYWTGRALA